MCAILEACCCVHAGEWISGAVCQGLVEFLVSPPTQRRRLVSVEVVKRVRVPAGSSTTLCVQLEGAVDAHVCTSGFWMKQRCMCNLAITVANQFAKLTLLQADRVKFSCKCCV